MASIDLLLRSEKGVYGNPTFRLTEGEMDDNLTLLQNGHNDHDSRIVDLESNASSLDFLTTSGNIKVVSSMNTVSFSLVPGLFQCFGGGILREVIVRGVVSDLDLDGNLTLEILMDPDWFQNGGAVYNNSIVSVLYPRVYEVYNETAPIIGNAGEVSDLFPIELDAGVSPRKQIVSIGSDKSIVFKIVGLNAFGAWAVVIGW